MSSDRLAGPIVDNFRVVWCALVEAAVRTVLVVVLDVLAQQLFELSVVPDERPVEELAPYGADPPFGIHVGKSLRLRLMAMVVRGLFV